MKSFIVAAILACLAKGLSAQDLRGDWRTAPDDNGDSGLIRVEQCGPSYCGTLIQAFDASGATIDTVNIGRQIIWDTNPTPTAGEFRGMIWSPDRDQTYESRLILSGNTLTVSGCTRILGVRACREGGVWQRIE